MNRVPFLLFTQYWSVYLFGYVCALRIVHATQRTNKFVTVQIAFTVDSNHVLYILTTIFIGQRIFNKIFTTIALYVVWQIAKKRNWSTNCSIQQTNTKKDETIYTSKCKWQFFMNHESAKKISDSRIK